MLEQTAIADAYSIAWEFCENPAMPDFSRFEKHPYYDDLTAGHYTDDTQRMLANALVILDNPTEIFNPLAYIRSYQNVFRNDPRAGYSRRYEAFLNDNLDVSPQTFASRLVRRDSNGSVMGVAVMGYLPNPSDVKLAAGIQAISTHSYETVPYAEIIALSAHHFIRGGSRNDLVPFLLEQLGEYANPRILDMVKWSVNTHSDGRVSMKASAATEFLLNDAVHHDTLTSVIGRAITRGGDTDSSAAIAVAVLSSCGEVRDDIPAHLYNMAENLDHLRVVDDRLRKVFHV